MKSDMVRPQALREGDKIAIVAPATEVKREYVEGAARWIESQGFEAVIAPHCLDSVSGTYAATERERLEDFLAACSDSEIRAILCARGGYGCVQIIGEIPGSLIANDPKWVIGFSDVSALHALMLRHGVMSLHAGMAKHLTESAMDDMSIKSFREILCGAEHIDYELTPADGIEICHRGECAGILRGGNFAVLNGLADTEFDLLKIGEKEDVILFLEDIGEGIYEVDRMLWRLHLSGSLHRAKGLIFGEFNNYKPDKNHADMEEMIRTRMLQWGISVPVVLNFPVGHVDGRNLPFVEGCRAELIADDSVKISMVL
ncbi:MAG: LD-carboxypeptidase [Prevotella sp.]|nr:LD-carboxypeptidase [Bacteroides sp.]MCM1366269.1 LD-carboxypeptidase [Prevotella sp.]MCM1436327.1 LD-carboxypeptidase [Prevotella sp.]